MKRVSYVVATLAAMVASGSAYALSCTPSDGYQQLTGDQITSLLVGSVACYPRAAPYTNQEYLAGGTITDYKQGPADTIDPSKPIGGYGITSTGANDTITYNYAGGPSFTYAVWGGIPPGSGLYDLCAGGTPLPIRVVNGSPGPC